jgi:hypothetical protein
MKYKALSKLTAIAFLFFGCNTIVAQTNFEILDHSENNIEVSGSSTFHDWTMETKTVTGNAQFNLEPGNDIIGLTKLEFSLPVLKLKSNLKALNKNAYKALKTNQFKNITYTLISAKIIGEKDYTYQIATVGDLTIAGVTKGIYIDIYCFANKNGSITTTAKCRIKMTDYGINPPNFMDGLMSTNDMVDIDICIQFER